MIKSLVASLLMIVTCNSFASVSESDLGALKGYTILGNYQITGWRDTDGKKGDAYEGCNYGRVLILNFQQAVTCSGYWYEYAYHPTVIILSNGTSLKMILNGSVRDIQ